MNFDELIQQVQKLSISDKWLLVKKVIDSLEESQIEKPSKSDWHEFLHEMYGSIDDPTFKRWEQGEYEEREPLE